MGGAPCLPFHIVKAIVLNPPILRYQNTKELTSQNLADDVFVHLQFLTAPDYVVELLTQRHGVGTDDAAARAAAVVVHTRTATAFVEQALSRATDASLLSCYYAVLNLMKVYVLFSSRYDALATNRRHGVQHLVETNTANDLRTERIRLHREGSIALFYEVVTEHTMPPHQILPMARLYPYIWSISAEWQMANGGPSRLARVLFDTTGTQNALTTEALIYPLPAEASPATLPELKALRDFEADPNNSSRFVSRKIIAATDDAARRANVRAAIHTSLLYTSRNGAAGVAISSEDLLLPEELPIALVFFHLSSVVRYDPEFFARLKDSRFWPVVLTARTASLVDFVVLCLSFTHQENLILHSA